MDNIALKEAWAENAIDLPQTLVRAVSGFPDLTNKTGYCSSEGLSHNSARVAPLISAVIPYLALMTAGYALTNDCSSSSTAPQSQSLETRAARSRQLGC